MKVFVTGANGMLATNIIEQLLIKGYKVLGVLRNRNCYLGIMHDNLELIEGDFTNSKFIDSTLSKSECDTVIHTAAITKQDLTHYDSYRQVNVCATEELVKCAIHRGVNRFIYVSSANTIGYGTPSSPSQEDMPMMPPFSDSFYARSKKEAEDMLLGYSESIDIIVANPTLMIGKYGTPKGSNMILNMARPITFCTSGGKNIIDVTEAALAIIAVMERGEKGEKYLICNENISFKDFFRLFYKVRHIIVIPRFILLFIGLIGSTLRLLSIRSVPSLTDMRSILINPGYSNNKLKTELNFSPKNLIESNNYNYSFRKL